MAEEEERKKKTTSSSSIIPVVLIGCGGVGQQLLHHILATRALHADSQVCNYIHRRGSESEREPERERKRERFFEPPFAYGLLLPVSPFCRS
jgi:homoserine dehydrogenase